MAIDGREALRNKSCYEEIRHLWESRPMGRYADLGSCLFLINDDWTRRNGVLNHCFLFGCDDKSPGEEFSFVFCIWNVYCDIVSYEELGLRAVNGISDDPKQVIRLSRNGQAFLHLVPNPDAFDIVFCSDVFLQRILALLVSASCGWAEAARFERHSSELEKLENVDYSNVKQSHKLRSAAQSVILSCSEAVNVQLMETRRLEDQIFLSQTGRLPLSGVALLTNSGCCLEISRDSCFPEKDKLSAKLKACETALGFERNKYVVLLRNYTKLKDKLEALNVGLSGSYSDSIDSLAIRSSIENDFTVKEIISENQGLKDRLVGVTRASHRRMQEFNKEKLQILEVFRMGEMLDFLSTKLDLFRSLVYYMQEGFRLGKEQLASLSVNITQLKKDVIFKETLARSWYVKLRTLLLGYELDALSGKRPYSSEFLHNLKTVGT